MMKQLWKIVWSFLKKIRIVLPIVALVILGIYPKELKVMPLIGICTPVCIVALSTISKRYK
jgi:hypothetical protein